MTTLSRGPRRTAVAALLGLLASTTLLGAPQAATGAPACGKTLAVLGALTGDAAVFGEQITRGVRLAVDQYNQQHPGCTVAVDLYDSQGSPPNAVPLAQAIVGKASILGVVGPMFSGESIATGPTFAKAGLPTVSPSATNPVVGNRGWKTFHRIIATDAAAGKLLGTYVRTKLGKTRVAVVTDDSDYGRVLARSVRSPLGKKVVLNASVKQGQTSFAGLVQRIRAKKVQAVVFAGYYPEGGRLAKQLAQKGWKGPFLGGDGLQDPGFKKLAGAAAASRAHVVIGAAPSTLSKTFTQAYRATYGAAPRSYALEGYDAARVFLAGLNAGATTRAAMLGKVDRYSAAGLTKPIRFTAKGELAQQRAWVYKPVGSGFVVRTRLG